MNHKLGFPADVAELIWTRDRGSCARCGRGLVREARGTSWAIHHRQPRGHGGAGKRRWWANLSANGVCLCSWCHETVEANRKDGIRDGFLVSALGIQRPEEVAIKHALFGVVRLDDHGGWELAA